MMEILLRILWVALMILVMINFSIKVDVKPVILIDESYSSKVVFGERLEEVERFFKDKGYRIVKFGSDTLTDIGGTIKENECPCVLVSDGLNNSSTDPLAVSFDKKVYPLLLQWDTIKTIIKDVYMKNPPPVGGNGEMRIKLSGCLNDTAYLMFKGKTYSKYSCEEVSFVLKNFSEKDEVKIYTKDDTLKFFIYGVKTGKPIFFVWKPSPIVRFLRGKFVDANVILKKDDKMDYESPFVVMVSPPKFEERRPSIVIVGDNTKGFTKIVGDFFVRGNTPPLRTVFKPNFKLDEIYESVGGYPLIARKGNALLILSPDIWKIWLADHTKYEDFINYIDENIKFVVDVYTEKPVFLKGENVRVIITGSGVDAISINEGKKIPFNGFYTYQTLAGDTGKNTIKVRFFKGKTEIFKRSVSYYVLNIPVEKRYLGVDTNVLKNIAGISGGMLLRDKREALNITERIERFNLARFYPFILMIVVLALLEWGIRRYKGKV